MGGPTLNADGAPDVKNLFGSPRMPHGYDPARQTSMSFLLRDQDPSTLGSLVPTRALRDTPPPDARRPRRQLVRTHEVSDLNSLFSSQQPASGGGKRIRICVIDTLLQTGGAEWFTTQLVMAANPGVFEFVVVVWRLDEEHAALAEQLKSKGIMLVESTSLSSANDDFAHWQERGLFEILDRLAPDQLFFSSQYLFDELSDEKLAKYPVVARISNFHPDKLAKTDFSAADRIICATQEQYEAFPEAHRDKAVVISTGVNTELFRPPSSEERVALKRDLGLQGQTVVLFVARLGDPLKRTPVFLDVVRAIRAKRSDVAFVVVGYFESHNNEFEDEFRQAVEKEEILWREYVPPWEMPDFYRTADILISASAPHEGLSNTVLQALASGTMPVVTRSAGMHELVRDGETGFIVDDPEAPSLTEALGKAADLPDEERAELAAEGRDLIEERFSLIRSARAYQREFVALHRRQPAKVCITDGYFGTGGAEWLAALLMLNTDPADTTFELVLHEVRTPLVHWMQERGFVAHGAPAGMSFSTWHEQGMQDAFAAIRPDLVMPCTITTWPKHDPFYRLLIISQNASDAAVLTKEQYDQADYILCVSEDVKNQLSADHQWKMSVLRNSIDLDMFHENAEVKKRIRDDVGMPHDAKVVLWCGRMHEARKRVDVLRDVIAGLRDDPSLHFLVVGYFRGDEGDRDGWIAFMKDHPNVSWVEDVTPWETPEYYASADLYLSTSGFKNSDFEGLSVATVQALATSLPVVTTMSGGQEEVVEHGGNGRLIDTGDVDGLVAALKEVGSLDAEGFGAMSRRSREKALESFDIKQHAKLYTGIARMLRDNVGTALAADPALPSATFAFADGPPDDEARLAASFLTYTWPLLREDAGDGAEATTIATDGGREAVCRALDEASAKVAPGERVAVRGLGRDLRDDGGETPSAGAVCAVLDHLTESFAAWSACERRGTDLIMSKR